MTSEGSRICRLELCELEGLHLAHDITPFHVRCEVCDVPAGELCDLAFGAEDVDRPRVCRSYHYKRICAARGRNPKPCKSMRDPWQVPCAEALDESIVRALADGTPKLLSQIVPIVENDYGKIADSDSSKMTQLQRRFKKLVAAGSAMRIEIGKRLYAYVLPDARGISDIDAIRETIMENFDREPRPWSKRALVA